MTAQITDPGTGLPINAQDAQRYAQAMLAKLLPELTNTMTDLYKTEMNMQTKLSKASLTSTQQAAAFTMWTGVLQGMGGLALAGFAGYGMAKCGKLIKEGKAMSKAFKTKLDEVDTKIAALPNQSEITDTNATQTGNTPNSLKESKLRERGDIVRSHEAESREHQSKITRAQGMATLGQGIGSTMELVNGSLRGSSQTHQKGAEIASKTEQSIASVQSSTQQTLMRTLSNFDPYASYVAMTRA